MTLQQCAFLSFDRQRDTSVTFKNQSCVIVRHCLGKLIQNINGYPTVHITRPKLKALSDREFTVLVMILQAKTNKEIGESLEISPRTAEVHRAKIMKAFGAKNAVHLVHLALDTGFNLDDASLYDSSRSVPGQK